MTAPRGLSADESEVWAKLAATVVPLNPHRNGQQDQPPAGGGHLPPAPAPEKSRPPGTPLRQPSAPPPPRPAGNRTVPNPGLDSHWERRLRAGTLAPDFTLDLHEHSLDAAYQRLLGGLDIARETGARVVLVIAGKERPATAADRGGQRGAIRAKLLDWLAASRHASAIAAIRKAHRRHGGDGALYVILKQSR
jgi:DNA-nicking Smr family endonuclease